MEFLEFLRVCDNKSIHFSMENEQIKINAPKETLTPDIVERLRYFKTEIIAWLRDNQSEKLNILDNCIPISAVSRAEKWRASYVQEQIWLSHTLNDMGDIYHFVRVLDLTGVLDIDALNATFSTIIERHEALRTVFFEEGGNLFQEVKTSSTIDIPIVNFSLLSSEQKLIESKNLQNQMMLMPFDLACDSMLKLQLICMDENFYQLIIVLHHIASDGWSLGLLVNEFQTLYAEYVYKLPLSLPALPIQYLDYAQWLRASDQSKEFSTSMDYWKKNLKGVSGLHTVFTDNPRPSRQSFKGLRIYKKLDRSICNALNNLAQRSNATLFIVLESLFAVLLARYSSSDDIVLGTPVANRTVEEIAGLIGCFVNIVTLRHQIDQRLSFSQLLSLTKLEILTAFNHQNIPFERVIQEVIKTRTASYAPLVQIAFALQNNDIPDLNLPGLKCNLRSLEKCNAHFDLKLDISEQEQGLELCWEYASDLFSHDTINRMANHFEQLIRNVLGNMDVPIGKLNILCKEERHQLIAEFNNTSADYPKEKCVHELFEAEAEKNPHAIAVVFEDKKLTYSELNKKANQLAHYLVSKRNVKPDTFVGIYLERSLDMVIGMLAILKSGGAYVPLDCHYPKDRLEYMLECACLTTVLTQTHLIKTELITYDNAVFLDNNKFQDLLKFESESNISIKKIDLSSNHLAYLIFTSGSTGLPKGVMVEHTGLVNTVIHNAKQFNVDSSSKFLQTTSFNFDAASWVIWMSLLHQSTLVIENNSVVLNDGFGAYIDQNKITHLMMTPSSLVLLDPKKFNYLKVVIVGGEVCSNTLASSWSSHVSFYNAYGPTEATICTTLTKVEPNKYINIGRPIQNMEVHVLNNFLCPVPINVGGELYIGGVGLARGYLNSPEQTAEKFISNPFYEHNNPVSSKYLYKTGDIVRWLPDGNLAFLGRIDHQVKIRGFRIELGEIENILRTHESVKDAIVMAKEYISSSEDKRLIAYVITEALDFQIENQELANMQAIFIEKLRKYLSASLPEYMVPASFQLLMQFPLTPNGKVDLNALPEPNISNLQSFFIAPRNKTEKTLCEIWCEILNIEKVGIADNYFLLGGDSLSAVKMVMQTNKRLNVSITIRELFDNQTVEQLASKIEQRQMVKGIALNKNEKLCLNELELKI